MYIIKGKSVDADFPFYYIEYKIIPKQAELKISAMGDAPVCFWVFMTN